MSKFSNFLKVAKLLVPVLVTAVNPRLAPLANTITDGIAKAEESHKTGAEKLALVQAMAHDAALGVNQAAGHEVVPVDGLDAATAHVINTAVEVVNLTHHKVVTQ